MRFRVDRILKYGMICTAMMRYFLVFFIYGMEMGQ